LNWDYRWQRRSDKVPITEGEVEGSACFGIALQKIHKVPLDSQSGVGAGQVRLLVRRHDLEVHGNPLEIVILHDLELILAAFSPSS
jgi:hypothetical protein